MAESKHDDGRGIAAQIAEVERIILQLRADMLGQRESLPDKNFSALRIQVGQAWYAMPTSAVREVIPLVATQPVPEAPPWALGTFRYRGRTLTAVDLHHRLYGTGAALRASMVMVVSKPPHEVGLVAESVGSLFVVDPARVEPPTSAIPQSPFLCGTLPDHGGRVLHLLSLNRLAHDSVLDLDDLPIASAMSDVVAASDPDGPDRTAQTAAPALKHEAPHH